MSWPHLLESSQQVTSAEIDYFHALKIIFIIVSSRNKAATSAASMDQGNVPLPHQLIKYPTLSIIFQEERVILFSVLEITCSSLSRNANPILASLPGLILSERRKPHFGALAWYRTMIFSSYYQYGCKPFETWTIIERWNPNRWKTCEWYDITDEIVIVPQMTL